MFRGRQAATTNRKNDLSVFDMSQDSEPPARTVFEESQEGAPGGRSSKKSKQQCEKARQEKEGSANNRARPNGTAHAAAVAEGSPRPAKKRNFDFDMSESDDDENYEPDLRTNKPNSRQSHNLSSLYKRNSAGNRVPWGEDPGSDTSPKASPHKARTKKGSPGKKETRPRTHAPSVRLHVDASRDGASNRAAASAANSSASEQPGPKPVFLFTYKGMAGYCEVQCMVKKVGPIEPPRMLATILPPDTEVQGLGAEVGGWGAEMTHSEESTTTKALLEESGHAHNVLSYHVQELRNTLSMAGYRCWKAGSERLDCIYLPSHVDTKTDGETMSYSIRGCNAERGTVFYSRRGEVPLSIRNSGALNSAERLLANLGQEPEEQEPKPRKRKAKQRPEETEEGEGEDNGGGGKPPSGRGRGKGARKKPAEGGAAGSGQAKGGRGSKQAGQEGGLAGGQDGGPVDIVAQIRALGSAAQMGRKGAPKNRGAGGPVSSPSASQHTGRAEEQERMEDDGAVGDDDWVTVAR